MNILFLAHFAGSPKYGMVYGHYHLAKEWVRQGHRVTIVAASFAHTRWQQPVTKGRIAEEYIDGIRYLWLRTPRYQASSSLGRVGSIFAFFMQAWLLKLPIDAADLVIASSHYPFAIHPAKKVADRYGARLVFEVRDLWPLTLVELGGVSPKHPLIRLMQYSEDYAYRHAEKVVSVLPCAKDYMVGHGMSPDKFTYVPNGIATDDSGKSDGLPDAHKAVLDEIRRSGEFLVGYAGKIGLSNVLNSLIEGVSLCSDLRVRAVILGEGIYQEELQRLADRLGVSDRITFLGPVSRGQVNAFLNYMDAAYIGYQSQPLYRFGVSPTKVNDYMLSALPIVYAVEAPGDVVAESGCGISCRTEDSQAVADAIRTLCGMSKADLAAMGERGRQWLLANRDYRVLAERFLSAVTGKQSPSDAASVSNHRH